MAKVVTLYINDTGIKLLVAKGKRVQKWAHLPLESGLVSDGAILNEEEVAAKVQELLKAQKVNTKKVIAGLSGLHCLTRPVTLPQLPKTLLPEAARQEAERIMPVPLEQLYLSWQIIPAPGEEMQVFLAASPRNAADALIKTLRLAGLNPYLIDFKPLALARVADKPTAIIVDTQSAELDIVIMVDGIPQPVRSLSLPSKASTLSEKLLTIREELGRTIKFYNSNHPENPLDSSLPIFVSGELAQEPEACQSLSDELNHPALPLSPPLECPEDLVPSQYMVNIGLALKELSPKTEANFSLVNLNFQPEVYRPKPISLTKTVIVPAIIVIAIGLLFPLVTRVRDAAADTALLRGELNTVNQVIEQRLAQVQAQKQNVAELETNVSQVEASRDTFLAVIDYIEDEQYTVNGDLEVTMSVLPGTIDLTEISHASPELNIRGIAPSEVEVLSYAKKLRASGRFSQVVISSVERSEEDETRFSLVLTSEG